METPPSYNNTSYNNIIFSESFYKVDVIVYSFAFGWKYFSFFAYVGRRCCISKIDNLSAERSDWEVARSIPVTDHNGISKLGLL